MIQELEIRLSGSGGQGLVLGARILARALVLEGFWVAQSQSFEPTARGGLSRSDLVASQVAVDYPLVTALDYVVVMHQIAVPVSRGLIKPGGLVLVDSGHVTDPPRGNFTVHSWPFTDTARRLGSLRTANIVALGSLVQAGGLCSASSLETAVREIMPERFLGVSLAGVTAGLRLAAETPVTPSVIPSFTP